MIHVQVTGGVVSAESKIHLVQQLITGQQQQLPAIIQSAPASEAAVEGQRDQQAGAGAVLVCTGADRDDVVLVGQLYEQAATHLLEVRATVQQPLTAATRHQSQP